MSENQIVFHKGYSSLKGIWRDDYTLYIMHYTSYIMRSSDLEKQVNGKYAKENVNFDFLLKNIDQTRNYV